MLHDLFTIAVNGRRQGFWILLLPAVTPYILAFKLKEKEMSIFLSLKGSVTSHFCVKVKSILVSESSQPANCKFHVPSLN